MAQQQPKLSHREPLVRVAKRGDVSGKKTFALYIVAFIAAFVAGGIFILALGVNPIEFYSTIVTGCFKTNLSMIALVRIIVPLLITSLGVALAFKMKFWNIGAEGQFIMGAVFASWAGLFLSGLPHWLLMICMFIAGMVGGGLWGLIAAFFKCKFNTNETL